MKLSALVPSVLRRLPRPSATLRISVGLLALTVSLILGLDLAVGLFPSDYTKLKAVRERSAMAISVQIKAVLAHPQTEGLLGEVMGDMARADADILSLGVRRSDGQIVAATADHQAGWRPLAGGRSTITQVVVPLNSSGGPWGQVEIRYRAVAESTWLGTVNGPLMSLLVGLGTAGVLIHYLYLRRMLQHLDPSSAIPERVRTAFNTLTEGLVVLDGEHRILLANDAFARLQPGGGKLVGRPIGELPWLAQAVEGGGEQPPWAVVMEGSRPVLGLPIQVAQADAEPLRALLNCTAIRDGSGQARGTMLTLTDVTELDRVNSRLRAALTELEDSRDQIQRQNEELQLLANYDPLTACMNRRAFIGRAERLMADALTGGQPLACLMTDIDKFKSFNDTYGHAVGDQVIQQVAKLLHGSLRDGDLLARWGGEEFCILLPQTHLAEAMRIAQRIRATIESQAGAGVRSVEGLRITASFGVSTVADSIAATLDQLVERADMGLYAAKEAGRNRVRFAGPDKGTPAEVPAADQALA